MNVLLWVDDLRPAPSGWVWARSVNEALAVVSSHTVTHMSLDHDLGDYAREGGDATRLTDWLAEHDSWPLGIRVHSANPVGVATMIATIDRYSPLPVGVGNARGVPPQGGWPPARA